MLYKDERAPQDARNNLLFPLPLIEAEEQYTEKKVPRHKFCSLDLKHFCLVSENKQKKPKQTKNHLREECVRKHMSDGSEDNKFLSASPST